MTNILGDTKLKQFGSVTFLMGVIAIRTVTYPFRLTKWKCTSKYKRDPNPPTIAIK